MNKVLYGFQCPRCYIKSGYVSKSAQDAPTCCGGVRMVAYVIQEVSIDRQEHCR